MDIARCGRCDFFKDKIIKEGFLIKHYREGFDNGLCKTTLEYLNFIIDTCWKSTVPDREPFQEEFGGASLSIKKREKLKVKSRRGREREKESKKYKRKKIKLLLLKRKYRTERKREVGGMAKAIKMGSI